MNLITKTFENQNIRIIEKNNDLWFIANDILKSINSTTKVTDLKHSIQEELGDEFVSNEVMLDSIGRKQETLCISEAALTFFISKSRTELGKRLNKWIHSEVLPSIRKHGAYMTDNTIEKALTDPDFLIQLATKLKEEKLERQRIEAEKQKLEEEQKALLPKAQVFDSIICQDGLFSIRSTAKTLQVPEKKFIEFLLTKKVMFRNPKGQLEPYAKTIDKNFMEIKLVDTEYGGAKSQAKFTAKGQAWVSLLVDKYTQFFTV